MKKFPCSLAFCLMSVLLALPSKLPAVDATWQSTGGANWLTGSNWSSNPAVPGDASDSSNTDLATFGASITSGANVQINFANTGGTFFLGAIEVSSAKTQNSQLTVRSNPASTAGVLTLNGRTIDSFDHVILSHNGANSFNITNGTGDDPAMDLALGNATNNAILTQNANPINISSNIIGASRNLTFTGVGSGTLTLSGNNSYSGTTTIGDATHAKTLIITGGSFATSNFILNNNDSTLILNAGATDFVHNGVLSGTGVLDKRGTGTLTLESSSPSFSGTAVIRDGLLLLNDSGALGTANVEMVHTTTGTFLGLAAGNFTGSFNTLNGGSSSTGGFVAYGGTRTVNINGDGSEQTWQQLTGTSNNGRLSLNNSTGTGTIIFENGVFIGSGSTKTFIIGNSTQAIDAIMTGQLNGTTGGAEFIGGGTVRLDNPTSNFSGNIIIGDNTTVIATSLADAASNSSIGASNSGNNADRLVIDSGTLRYSGGEVSTNRNFTIGAGNATIQASGSGALTMTGSPSFTEDQNRTLTLGGTNTGQNTFAGTLANSGTGVLTLNKNDGGTWVLTGNNTYTGATTISAGTLLINGNQSAATGAVSVATGATLGGSGIIGGATTISGTHSPGNSPGIQTFLSDLTYNNGSNVVWELTGNTRDLTDRGTSFDGINVSGDLTFGFTTLDLVFNLVGSTVNWTDSFWSQSYAGSDGWLVYDVSGTTFNSINLSIDTQNWVDGFGNAFNSFRSGNTFSLVQIGDNIFLNYTVIPEPSTGLLLLIGGAAWALSRRRSAKL